MHDTQIQRQIRALLPKPPPPRIRMLPALVTVASLTFALTFTLVLYVGQVHKIPINTALTRLEHMLAQCTGRPSSEIRNAALARSNRRYPSFTMAEQLDAVELALDRIEEAGCMQGTRVAWPVHLPQASIN